MPIWRKMVAANRKTLGLHFLHDEAFEQIYRREMSEDERRILHAAKKIIQRKLTEYSAKVG